MKITVLYPKTVGVPDDCRHQQFGYLGCPSHRDLVDQLAWRHAETWAITAAAGFERGRYHALRGGRAGMSDRGHQRGKSTSSATRSACPTTPSGRIGGFGVSRAGLWAGEGKTTRGMTHSPFRRRWRFRERKIRVRTLLIAAIVVVLLSGCAGSGPSWDLAGPTATDVVPSYAEYEFVTSEPINDSHHAQFVFTVLRDMSAPPGVITLGHPVLRFSADGFRSDTIEISRGAFFTQWGSIGGTDCPTDSYALSGHFTEPGRAEGTIKLAYDGRVTATATFVATLKTPIDYPE